ncbi:MAG: 23S rRNA (guanosine(2251)-2'-O)-methyltransferase RlmB [Erysipelotrichaceae bacterium]|nr:23S rRNA (guanosine(2251)-2'-O)-methyltransferase RlmB [Erysipelotrichaceae bacterium]MCI9524197.1 23S rRNA (guanosine(2251)-2'-O)-methyltransferase RlmB [Erysipelotrichaceae bacterium]
MTQYVYGKNVVNQLLQNKKTIYEVILSDGWKDKNIVNTLKKRDIPIKILGKKKMDALLKNENHQGIAAKIDDYKTYDIEDLLEAVPEGKLPLFVLLDGIEDPHNLGAILRTCDCVGADGVILGKHRSVALTPTVAKVSTGAIDTIKVAVVNNLTQTLEQLKKKGFWIAAADAIDAMDYRKGTYDVPLVLVVGSEGFGISKLVRKHCDYAIALPMEGCITSLNASVACAVLLYEIYAQRNPVK